MPTAELTAVRTWYEVRGEGPPVLVVNGTGSDLRNKPGLLESPLGERCTLLAYDHRGLGRSVPRDPSHQPTMADFATDALELLDHVGWSRCGVVGVSFGGMVAQEIALAAPPGRLSALALVCTSSGGAGGSSAPLHELYELPLAERAPALAKVNDTRCTTDEARLRAWVAALAQGPDQPLPEGLRRQLEARRRHDTFDRLGGIDVPTLVASGTHDGIAPVANGEALAAAIPGAELRRFDGGHLFLLEDRSAFPAIEAFLLAHAGQPA